MAVAGRASKHLRLPRGVRRVRVTLTRAYGLPSESDSSREGFQLGFSKANELRVTRLAMFGWALSLAGEHVTGRGPLGQLGLETGVPLAEVEPAILGFVAANWLLALLPGEGVFQPPDASARARADDEAPAPGGSFSAASIVTAWASYVGDLVGLTKERELAIGRCAGFGWGACLLGEALTGKGLLEQLDLETGTTLAEAHPALLTFLLCLVVAAVNEGGGEFLDGSGSPPARR